MSMVVGLTLMPEPMKVIGGLTVTWTVFVVTVELAESAIDAQ